MRFLPEQGYGLLEMCVFLTAIVDPGILTLRLEHGRHSLQSSRLRIRTYQR
jgi:hypothetical protein